MKARDLAAVLLDHPDLEVVVRLDTPEGEARTFSIRSAGRTPLSNRIALEALDPEGQLEMPRRGAPGLELYVARERLLCETLEALLSAYAHPDDELSKLCRRVLDTPIGEEVPR